MTTEIDKSGSAALHAQAGEVEVPELRTRTGKTFDLGDGRYRWGGSVGPIHYRMDPFDGSEPWSEIDLDVQLTPGEPWDAACETNGYQVRFWQSRQIAGRTIRYVAQFRRAGSWIGMAPVGLIWQNGAGERELIARPQPSITPEIDNEANRLTWAGCFGPGLDFRYNLRPDEFFKTVIVRAKSDLPAPGIGGPGLQLTVVMALKWHTDASTANGYAAGVETEHSDDLSELDNPDEQLADDQAAIDALYTEAVSRVQTELQQKYLYYGVEW